MSWIMVAGPYTAGGADRAARAANLTAMNEAAVALWERGWTPVIGVNMALPMIEAAGESRFEEIMTPVSLALSERCDAALRLGGASEGADAEAERIAARGGTVYRALEDVPSLK